MDAAMSAALDRGVCLPAYLAYVDASKEARIPIHNRDDGWITQAMGNKVAASAGFHKKDGVLGSKPYTAAIDLSVRGLTNSQIASWLEALCYFGFVAFYRHLRSFANNRHIHGNFAGVPQKEELDEQNEDFFAGRDGLVGSRRIDDEWWYPELEARKIPERMFRLSNPRGGKEGRVVTREDVVRKNAEPTSNALYFGDEKTPRLWMPVIDGVSYAPVRAWGQVFGWQAQYDPKTHTVDFIGDKSDLPIAVKLLHDVGHAPVRQLARQVGLKVDVPEPRKVIVHR